MKNHLALVVAVATALILIALSALVVTRADTYPNCPHAQRFCTK